MIDQKKLIQFLTTPEMWDTERGGPFFEGWAEGYQLLLNKIRAGEFDLDWPNSTEMIGNSKKWFEIACKNPNHNMTERDWHPWYNGWMEGRFDLLGYLIPPKYKKEIKK